MGKLFEGYLGPIWRFWLPSEEFFWLIRVVWDLGFVFSEAGFHFLLHPDSACLDFGFLLVDSGCPPENPQKLRDPLTL